MTCALYTIWREDCLDSDKVDGWIFNWRSGMPIMVRPTAIINCIRLVLMPL